MGFNTADDAAVYRLTKDLAVVETVDFFPPVVDDPFAFGQIAAANALSDIWAMGARPLFALNLVGFPKELPMEILGRILAGGQDKADEAGVPILGGHTIQDPEPKYGMAVTGVVHPKKILTNAGAKPGDVLLLTKPLGSGIATTAIKRGMATPALIASVTELMSRLNKGAGEVLASGKFRVNALTDVTGFGLLGHLYEMMAGAKVRAQLFIEAIPMLQGVPDLARQNVLPGGTRANLEYVQTNVTWPEGLPEDAKFILADAQTNGGLLASIPKKDLAKAERAFSRARIDAAIIGEVRRGKPGIDVVA